MRLREGIQLIHIKSNEELKLHTINNALQLAKSNSYYAKFYTDTVYIQVNFMRDGTMSVASNIRTPIFNNDLFRLNRDGWTIPRVRDFIYKWMQIYRKNLY